MPGNGQDGGDRWWLWAFQQGDIKTAPTRRWKLPLGSGSNRREEPFADLHYHASESSNRAFVEVTICAAR